MAPILVTRQLSKNYGRIRALDQLDITVEPGQVFGFLGPNGSGKTTTLALLLHVLRPTSGEFSWFGQPTGKNVRRQIGAILESPCFYPYLSGYRNLCIAAAIKMSTEKDIETSLEIVGLSARRNDPFKTYSLGMKQRLAIASALLSNPKVLILDEPTNGLDPQGIVEIRNLIRQIADTGKTIILASHLLDEVQRVCSHFLVLRKGQKLYQGSVTEALSDTVQIALKAEKMVEMRMALEYYPGISDLIESEGRLLVRGEELSPRALNQYLFQRGIVLTLLQKNMGNLESRFLEILGEND